MIFAHNHWSISGHSVNNEPGLLVLIRRNVLNLLDRLLLWNCELCHMLNWLRHRIIFLFPVEHFMNLLLGVAFCRQVLRVDRLLNVIMGISWLLNDLGGLNGMHPGITRWTICGLGYQLTLGSHALALVYHHRLLTLRRCCISLIKLRVENLLIGVRNFSVLSLHNLHLFEKHLHAILLLKQIELGWVLE